jgi:hypothetical protein
LKDVFGKKFHFDVSSEVRLKNTKKPQITLNKAIIDHMEEFDSKNNLLIVYYTGHGSLIKGPDGEDRLQLAAYVQPEKRHCDKANPTQEKRQSPKHQGDMARDCHMVSG